MHHRIAEPTTVKGMGASFFSRRSIAIVLLLLASSLLLVACEGKTVDRGAPSFVDSNSAGTFDRESAPGMNSPQITKPGESGFVAPPGNYTFNATITIDEKMGYVGKNAIKVWVWNTQGVQSIVLAEGSSANILRLKMTIQFSRVTSDGSIMLLFNGKELPALKNREETSVGTAYIFVSDVFLNKANK